MIILFILFIIQIKADDKGKCGDYCTYTFIESTGTLIFDGNYQTYDYKYLSYRPWDSYKDKIENIQITGNIKYLGQYSFYGCTNLKHIDFGYTVKEIGSYAFQECTSLKTITIPEQVMKIYSWAFIGCTP